MLIITATMLLCQITFEEYNPPDAVNHLGLFTDILSHCPIERREPQRGWTRQSHFHEMVHFASNRITSERRKESFYVGEGKCLSFNAQPNITLLNAAEKVRVIHRNDAYRIYFIQLSGTNNNWPFSILDEFNAYRLGVKHATKEQIPDLCAAEQLKSFHAFSDALIESVKQRYVNYQELKKLTEFVRWLKDN